MPGDPRGWEAPDHLRIYEWDKIIKVMKHLGYALIDIHEHEFKKDRVSVEFGSIDSLPDFAEVSESDIELIHIEGSKSGAVSKYLQSFFSRLLSK